MSYCIVGDSCTDLTKEMLQTGEIRLAPLSIVMGEDVIMDDDTFDQKDFLARVEAYPECAKSGCPSPEAFARLFEGYDEIYCVTLSSKMSGSYNSAALAKRQYLENHPETQIEIIDSMTASVGQTLIVLKIKECKEAGMDFKQTVCAVSEYRDSLETKFVLESLETFRKNGRLSNLKAVLVDVLNIKPIMESDGTGAIQKMSQARGVNRALHKLTEYIAKDAKNAKDRILGIAHCNNLERALMVRDEIVSRIHFRDVIIVDTTGISSLYANDGGIIVCY